jgi:hypothetical protein
MPAATVLTTSVTKLWMPARHRHKRYLLHRAECNSIILEIEKIGPAHVGSFLLPPRADAAALYGNEEVWRSDYRLKKTIAPYHYTVPSVCFEPIVLAVG